MQHWTVGAELWLLTGENIALLEQTQISVGLTASLRRITFNLKTTMADQTPVEVDLRSLDGAAAGTVTLGAERLPVDAVAVRIRHRDTGDEPVAMTALDVTTPAGVLTFSISDNGELLRQAREEGGPDAPLTPGELTGLVRARLLSQIDEVEIATEGPLGLVINHGNGGEAVFSLEGLWKALPDATQPLQALVTECTRQIQRRFATASEHPPEEETRSLAERVRLALRGPSEVDDLNALLAGQGEAVAAEPFGSGLWVVYLLDHPHVLEPMTWSEARSVSPDSEALRALALQNLRAHCLPLERIGDGPAYMIECQEGYETGLLLLPELWDAEAERLASRGQPGRVVVCAPARDVLLVTAEGSPEGLLELRAIADEIMAEGDHTLSDQCFAWTDGAWQPLS